MAVLLPSCVVTVIVAVPTATPVTRPELLTVAKEVFDELQVTVLFVAFEGATVAVSCWVAPTLIEAVVGLTVTPVTATLLPQLEPETIVTFLLPAAEGKVFKPLSS